MTEVQYPASWGRGDGGYAAALCFLLTSSRRLNASTTARCRS